MTRRQDQKSKMLSHHSKPRPGRTTRCLTIREKSKDGSSVDLHRAGTITGKPQYLFPQIDTASLTAMCPF